MASKADLSPLSGDCLSEQDEMLAGDDLVSNDLSRFNGLKVRISY
jgi:hypothetical protein